MANSGKYDVVIIGAGLGGMLVGALLCKKGYKTLIAEKRPIIGGRFSTLPIKGYLLTNGPVSIDTTVNGGNVCSIFDEVGADYPVITHPPIKYRIGGEDYQPPEKGRLRALIARVSKDEKENERLNKAFSRGLAWLEPSNRISFKDWILQFTDNEKILGLFAPVAGAMFGQTLEEMPVSAYFQFIKEAAPLRDYGFPTRGCAVLMDNMADRIRAMGGEIWTHSPAKKILINDNTATGAIIEKEGKEIEVAAKVVIGDSGPRATIELGGEENFEKSYLKLVEQDVVSVPIILVAVGSKRPLIDCHATFLTKGRGVSSALFCPTHMCPDLAPKGHHLTYVAGMCSSSIMPVDYKKEIGMLLEDARDNIPGFDRDAEPLLYYTHHGKDWPQFRCRLGFTPPVRTPVINLYNVGDGVGPVGWSGTAACGKTAKLVAEDVIRRITPG